MTTATVTRKLRAEGFPVELVRGNGYHYWIYDDGDAYETESVMIPHFRDLTVGQWIVDGRDFAARAARTAEERRELHSSSTFKLAIGGGEATVQPKPVQPVEDRDAARDGRSNKLKTIAGRSVQVETEKTERSHFEALSDGEGRSFGELLTYVDSNFVHAKRANHEAFAFDAKAFANSKAKAKEAARKWLVEGEAR